MCPEWKAPSRTTGFALPAAVFVLVVVALIIAAMVRLNSGQASQVNLSLLSARANWAVQSGLEWAMYGAVNNGQCQASQTLTLNGFEVRVRCSATAFNEAGASSVTTYQMMAEAYPAGGQVDDPDYVYRSSRIELLLKEY